MLFAIGAASSAIDLLKSLTSPNAASTQSATFSATPTAPSDNASTASTATASGASSQGSTLSAGTMSALLDAQSQSNAAVSSTTAAKSQSKALKDLFNLIDGNGDGSITKSEFENALGAGGTNTANADSVFAKLDTDGDGNVSLDEMKAALQTGKTKRAHHGKPPGQTDQASQTDPLLKALDDANTASAETRKANASYLSISQIAQQQSQVTAASSGASVSVSA